MKCKDYNYQNLNKNQNLGDIIINNQNYGSTLNNNLNDVTNFDYIDQTNNYQEILLPHQKKFDDNIYNSYDASISLFQIIKNRENPFPKIFSSPNLIFGIIIILFILLIIFITLKKILS